MAFIYDTEDLFERRVNPDTLQWQRIATAHWNDVLEGIVATHVAETDSRFAKSLLHDWARVQPKFWQVTPKEYVKYLKHPLVDDAVAQRA